MSTIFRIDNFTFEVVFTQKEFETLLNGRGDKYELNTLIYKGMLAQCLYMSQFINNLAN